MYQVKYSKKATKQLREMKNQTALLQKISKMVKEIATDPYSPKHKFERLKHNFKGFCSKRIDKKNRILYQVKDKEVIVLVISVIGHYGE